MSIDALDSLEVRDDSKELIEEAKKQGLDISDDNVGAVTKAGKIDTNTDYAEVREQAVRMSLIPSVYKDAKFDTTAILDRLKKRNEIDRLDTLYKDDFERYSETCNGIISALRIGVAPTRSYIIGSPKGLGGTEFANECIVEMVANGMRAVPFISLFELATIRSVQEKTIEKPLKVVKKDGLFNVERNDLPEFVKLPDLNIGRFSFSEYLNSDCLFVAFSDVRSKELESHILKQVLDIRGMKGLPTIALIGSSIDYYRRDAELDEFVWQDIITAEKRERCYDMMYHVSCYRVKIDISSRKTRRIDSETGLILK